MSRRKKLHQYVFHVGRWTIVIGRWALYVNITLAVLMALSIFLARLWLPTLVDRKADVEQFLTSKTTYEFSIDRLSTYWDGIYPGLKLHGLHLKDKGGAGEVLKFDEVRASIGLLPLFKGSLQLGKFTIINPELELGRNSEGRFYLRGLSKDTDSSKKPSVKVHRLLSRLNEVVIQNGTLLWRDAMEGHRKLEISSLNMVLTGSGNRRKISISARFPEKICLSCYVSIEFDAGKVPDHKWDGEIYVHAVGLVPENLPLAVAEHLPEKLSGKFDVLIRSDIFDNRVTSARGYVGASNLIVPVSAGSVYGLDSVRAQIDWEQNGKFWELKVEELNIGIDKKSWNAESLYMEYGEKKSVLRAKRIDLDSISTLIRKSAFRTPLIENILQLDPKGELTDVLLIVDGPVSDPKDFSFNVAMSSLATRSYGRYPGISGISGDLNLSSDSGEVVLNSDDLTISAKQHFRSELDFKRVAGSISWNRKETGWSVVSSGVDITNDDLDTRIRFSVDVPLDSEKRPSIDLNADIKHARLTDASHYFPVKLIKPKLLSWLDTAVVGGQVTSGNVTVKGNLQHFPFIGGDGLFDSILHIEDGVLDYLPGFPQLEEAKVLVKFRANKMFITAGEGKLGDLDVSRLAVTSDNLKNKDGAEIRISGQLLGEIDATLDSLRSCKFDGEEAGWVQYLSPEINGTGSAGMGLDLVFWPRKPKQTTVLGEYRFHDSLVNLPVMDLQASALSGNISFDNAGISGGRVNGRLLGGQSVLAIKRQEDAAGNPEVIAELNGQYTDIGLAEAFGQWMTPYVFGQGSWNAKMLWNQQGQTVHLMANTDKLKLDLPPPLEKTIGANKPLIAATRISKLDEHVINFRLGELFKGAMYFKKNAGSWSLWGSHLALADASAHIPYAEGLEITADSDYVDADAWLVALDRGGDEGEGIPEIITRMNGQFGKIDAVDRRFGKHSINLERNDNRWTGRVKGGMVDGHINAFFGKPFNSFELDLNQLTVPREPIRKVTEDFDPRAVPELSIKATKFQYGKMHFGKMELAGEPDARGWQLSSLTLKRPESKIYAQGKMVYSKLGTNADFEALLDTTNIGDTLVAFDFPRQVTGGEAKVRSKLSWERVPTLEVENMKATASIDGKKGQFVEVEQGAGRLLGIFDPAAFTRYLQLDFRPIFGKGYAFDEIRGDIRIDQGHAYTHNVVIRGPTADIRVSGRVGLLAEDYDLIVGINPGLADKAAIGAIGLGAPQIGAAILLFKKVFKKQSKKTNQLTYTVKGSWDDPVLDRVGAGAGDSQTDTTDPGRDDPITD